MARLVSKLRHYFKYFSPCILDSGRSQWQWDRAEKLFKICISMYIRFRMITAAVRQGEGDTCDVVGQGRVAPLVAWTQSLVCARNCGKPLQQCWHNACGCDIHLCVHQQFASVLAMLLGVSETFGSLSCVCAAETVGGLWHILCSQDIQCFVQSYSKLPSVICVHVRHDQLRPSVICMSCVLCNRNLNSLCVLCNRDCNGLCGCVVQPRP